MTDRLQGAVVRFREDPACRVLVALGSVGALGLTLTHATTVYMLEPLPRAAIEAQAMNRVHRIGQTRPTRCLVFYYEDTIEQRLLHWRTRSRVGRLVETHTTNGGTAAADNMDDDEESELLAGTGQGPAGELDVMTNGTVTAIYRLLYSDL